MGEGEKLKKRIDDILAEKKEVMAVVDSRKGHFYLVEDIAFVIELVYRTFLLE